MISRLFNIFRISKKYDHIISLGYNCEIADQFILTHKYIESSFLNWAYSSSINDVIYTLNNLDLLCSGNFMYPHKNIFPLWKCLNTNISFHGREPFDFWESNPSQENINNDKEELISRINYLKNKFINIIHSKNKKILFIYKYKINEKLQENNTDAKNINKLYSTIKNICTCDFDLLIIVERKFYSNININNNIYIRNVSFFANDASVTGNNNDHNGWSKIFNEFIYKHIPYKKQSYKFDDIN